jgi:hypothetical protein
MPQAPAALGWAFLYREKNFAKPCSYRLPISLED